MQRTVLRRAAASVLAGALSLAATASACQVGGNVHVPDGVGPDAPLVVALHGCTQTAAEFEVQSGWSELADRHGFVVLYPEQPTCGNQFRCFNWFDPAEITRGGGEVAEILEMVTAAREEHSIDPGRIYVAGFSAGGAMTVALMASYPEVFRYGAVMAGLPYKIAAGPHDAFPSMMVGKDKSPGEWADIIRAEHPGYAGTFPKLIAFHGSRDRVVNSVNMRELVEQWTELLGADQSPDDEETARGHVRKVYEDARGEVAVTSYRFPTMGHAVPVDPGDGPEQGGQTGKYAKDVDLFGAREAAKAFGLVE